jgi:hypothetical protein
MSLGFVTSAVWLFALLTGVSLCRASVRRPGEIAAVVGSAAVLLLAAYGLKARPEWVGVVVGVIAVWRLIGRPSPLADNLMSGACLGLAGALYVAQGVQPALAVALTVATFGVALWLASAVKDWRGWGLALAALAAPVAGLLPALAFGWRSAQVLNRAAAESAVRPIPWWTLGWVGLALAAGVVRGLWVRR